MIVLLKETSANHKFPREICEHLRSSLFSKTCFSLLTMEAESDNENEGKKLKGSCCHAYTTSR